MATSIPASSPVIKLLQKHAPSTLPDSSEEYNPTELAKSTFPHEEYSDAEKAEIHQWLITSFHIASPEEDAAKTAERLASLNTHLSTRTTILGSKPSLADVALYARLAPAVSKWSSEERTGERGYHHIVRHVAFVQGSPRFGLDISEEEKVSIDEDDVLSPIKPIDPKAEKERKKREKEAAAAAGAPNGTPDTTKEPSQPTGGRKAKKEAKQAQAADGSKPTGDKIAEAVGAEVPVSDPSAGAPKEGKKKEKAPKPKPEPPKETPLSPRLIDLRVGHILKAENHPNADSLYVSTIACGDPPGTDNTSEYEGQVVRTVCSGLNGLVPLAEMQDRQIIAVCNLKPVTMRGVKSAAMVLAASPRGDDAHGGPVELVSPPPGAKAGDRVCFEGWEGEPEGMLNPKKKVWEACQVGFTTTDACEVAFDAGAVAQLEGQAGVAKLVTDGGVCTVKSLKGATVR